MPELVFSGELSCTSAIKAIESVIATSDMLTYQMLFDELPLVTQIHLDALNCIPRPRRCRGKCLAIAAAHIEAAQLASLMRCRPHLI